MTRLMRTIALGFLALSVIWTGGCSSFESDWNEALAQPLQETDVVGCWVGTWKSDANGHSGDLRCILTSTGPQAYSARYHATYAGFLTFEYTTPLTGRAGASQRVEIQGQEDLGFVAGGIYKYAGYLTQKEFFSTYKSSSDYGTYRLSRP